MEKQSQTLSSERRLSYLEVQTPGSMGDFTGLYSRESRTKLSGPEERAPHHRCLCCSRGQPRTCQSQTPGFFISISTTQHSRSLFRTLTESVLYSAHVRPSLDPLHLPRLIPPPKVAFPRPFWVCLYYIQEKMSFHFRLISKNIQISPSH